MHACICMSPVECSTCAKTCLRFCINWYYYMLVILTIFHSRFYITWLGKLIDMCHIFRKHSSYQWLWVRIVFIVSHICQSEELHWLPRNNFCMTIFVLCIPITCKIYGTCYYCTFLYHELLSSWVLCVRGYVQFQKTGSNRMSLPNIFCRNIVGLYGDRVALVRCGNPWL